MRLKLILSFLLFASLLGNVGCSNDKSSNDQAFQDMKDSVIAESIAEDHLEAEEVAIREARATISRIIYQELYRSVCNRENYETIGAETKDECYKAIPCVGDLFSLEVPGEKSIAIAAALEEHYKGFSIEEYFDSRPDLGLESKMDRAVQLCASGRVDTGTKDVSQTSQGTKSSISIDQNSLTTSSYSPTISGTADIPTNNVFVSVRRSSDGQGGYAGNTKIENGKWSITIPLLSSDLYDVKVYDGGAYSRGERTVLATGKLRIKADAPSATIDERSLTSNSNNPTITGTASNVDSVMIQIDNDVIVLYLSTEVPVKNNKWSLTIPSEIPDGQYAVTIFGSTDITGDPVKLKKGILKVEAN